MRDLFLLIEIILILCTAATVIASWITDGKRDGKALSLLERIFCIALIAAKTIDFIFYHTSGVDLLCFILIDAICVLLLILEFCGGKEKPSGYVPDPGDEEKDNVSDDDPENDTGKTNISTSSAADNVIAGDTSEDDETMEESEQ